MQTTGLASPPPLVLVVDDQEANVRLAGAVLTGAGFDIMPALSGEQAFRRLSVSLPDVILLDMRMPGQDGFDVLARLKSDQSTADIPVVFVTAAHEREFVVKALDAGAADYITKPFVTEELVARVRTHANSKQLRDRLRKAIIQREELGSVVAHDLKNPLFAISLHAGLVRDAAGDAERVIKLANSIESSATKALDFVSQYLEARADVELRRGYEPRRCEPVLLIETIIEEFAEIVAHKGQTIETTFGRRDAILTDVDAFGVVLRNLLSNASKYSPPNSKITVQTRSGRPGMLQTVVLDQGPGIAAEQRKQLFQRFVRLSPRPTGGESSSGVGLASAMREAGWMGGELWYDDAPGGGAAFSLELPLAPADSPQAGSSESSSDQQAAQS